mgnify:CR=1 FL=1
MNIFDRLILVICSLCLAILSIAFILFPFQVLDILSMDSINLVLENIKGNYIYSIIGLAFLLASIRFIFISLKSSKEKSKITYIIQRTDYGEINISSETIIGLVMSVCDKFTGVKNIKTKVQILEGQLFIDLKGEVSPEINIPETTKELQNKVKEHVENCTGVNVSEIKVIISNVAAPIRNVK